uniref:MerR family transcriptional regulator n=1 Tax=Nonomuraea pusilla TaxID=46177 RepID=UPI0006E134EC|nr:MerR family transcriptional regulator [Nonomuraea pusilla]
MRIGEIAALVGVSTRTVRYYHHVGLLPEPPRRPNGYREYELRDAVVLARIRRLAELGLSLEELRDALADDAGKELREVLLDLDADLAREQEAIAERRRRLAALLERADLRPGWVVPSDAADVLRDLHAKGSRFADVDRELLMLMNLMADPADQDRVLALMRPLTEPDRLAQGHALYRRLDALSGAGADDPRVPALAVELAAHLPDEMARALAGHLPGDQRWLETLSGELSPAQAEVFRLMVNELKERA